MKNGRKKESAGCRNGKGTSRWSRNPPAWVAGGRATVQDPQEGGHWLQPASGQVSAADATLEVALL